MAKESEKSRNTDQVDYPTMNKFVVLDVAKIRAIASRTYDPISFTKPTNLKQFLYPITLNGRKSFFVLTETWQQTRSINLTTDYFTQYARVKCKFIGKISPLQFYQERKQELDEMIQTKGYPAFHEHMYHSIKMCNNFRISVALTLFKFFRPKTILDISAGWGDRLLSSILYGAESYYGADPNTDLQYGYNKIIQTFVPTDKQKNFRVDPVPFEEAKIPLKKYDMVFTSPPFFDKEDYSKDSGDSLTAWNTFEKWYGNFLVPVVKKAAAHTTKNGYILIYIEINKPANFREDFIRDITKDGTVRYCGHIYYYTSDGEHDRARPFVVFQKK